MKGYDPIPLIDALRKNARPSTLDMLPGKYPFWSRHASATGMCYIDFDPSITYQEDGVDIDINELNYNFPRTPKLMAWFRFADSALNYTDATPIYKLPNYAPDAVYRVFIDSERKLLRFSRITLAGSGPSTTERVYIRFFLFDDDVFQSVEERTEQNL